MSMALESERYRAERLESQMNDLTELHQVISADVAVRDGSYFISSFRGFDTLRTFLGFFFRRFSK